MSVKRNKLMNQESRGGYGKEAAEGATSILLGDDEFDRADDKLEEARVEENAFDAARGEEITVRARSQMAGNLPGYATGTANKPEEDDEEENAAGNRKQPARKPVRGSHAWGNENAPTSALCTLGIPGGAARRFTKQATTFPT